MTNTKDKFHFNQSQLYDLGKEIINDIDRIFEHFNVELTKDYTKYVGVCPIHGGNNPEAFNLYYSGSGFNWVCYTRQCEYKFVSSPVGLVRGLLSRNNGWDGDSSNGIISLADTIQWSLQFLGKEHSLFIIETNPAILEKTSFIRQVNNLSKTHFNNNGDHQCLLHNVPTRHQIRSLLDIPAKFYLDRGYSEAILDKYDVGFCSNVNKKMFGRVVVPIYDIDYNYVGCSGRILTPYCPLCKNYHEHGHICSEDTKKAKWKHSNNFKAQHHLYNLCLAKNHIKNSHTVIIVEGPGDVWRLEEADIHNSVCIFGTHLSPFQKTLLDKSGALNIIILTDNGGPGRKAAQVIMEQYSKQYNIKIPTFSGEDIGSLGVQEIKEIINNV